MLRRTLAVLALIIAVLAAYLALAPVPVEPVAWSPAKDAGYTGAHAANTRLAGLRHIALGQDSGPEHIAIGPDGMLYAAVAGGKILRMRPDGSDSAVWAQTGGRVLGFDFDAQGRLIAADAMRGLLAISPGAERTVQVLDGAARYADGVVVARDGRIYYTDASLRFAPGDWGGTFEASVLDLMEHSATGRVLVHDPASGKTEVVMDGLSFANGIALSADERALFVAETGQYRVWKLDVEARRLNAGKPGAQATVLLANLPGFPDNLMRGRDGRIWLGFAKPRSAAIDGMAGKPFLRKVTLRLPRALWPIPRPYGHVVAFNETGEIVADLQDPSGAYPETTSVTETADRLYIQSLHAPVLGWLPAAPGK